VQKLVGELFGGWKSPSPYQEVTTSYQKSEPLDKNIDTPDKQNALIIAGVTLQMNDENADYPALSIANYIYGGSVGSRLFSRIRDKEGLSYGVGSNFSAPTKEDSGAFIEFAICAPQNTPKAEASLKDELAKTLKDGFSKDEVAAAKKAWLQERQVSRSEDQSLASMLEHREFYGRTMKFDEALEAKVAALTAAQVSDAFRKYVDPAAMAYIKAGDFKKAGVYQGSN